MSNYSWIKNQLEMLYICEYIQIGYEMKFNPGAMGNGTFNHNGSASCNFHGYSKPLIKINITPTFPEPKPVGVGLMAMELKTGKLKQLK